MNLRTFWIIWAALLGSLPIYGVVAFTAAPPSGEGNLSPFFFALLAAAMGSTVMSFVLPAVMRRRSLKEANFEVEEVEDRTKEVMFRDMPPRIRQLANVEDVQRRVIPLWWTPFILELALSESVAIYGLVLAFVGFPAPLWIPFSILAAILMLMRMPLEGRIRRAVERATDARWPS
ncbi:MAG: hypothetical protein AAGE52_31345 [Myxococcota bacterium]